MAGLDMYGRPLCACGHTAGQHAFKGGCFARVREGEPSCECTNSYQGIVDGKALDEEAELLRHCLQGHCLFNKGRECTCECDRCQGKKCPSTGCIKPNPPCADCLPKCCALGCETLRSNELLPFCDEHMKDPELIKAWNEL